jgi:hypothetical protein
VEAAAVSILPELSAMGGPGMGMSTDQIGALILERIG